MRIERVEAAFEECERHLDRSNSYGTEVEAIITSYISGVIYSAFEKQARNIVAARGSGDGTDTHLSNFSNVAATRLMRSIRFGDIAGVTGWFHMDCRERFRRSVSSEAQNAWDTIIINRNNFAHEGEDAGSAVSNLTFHELKRLYPLALQVLDGLESAISSKTHR
jgi:hypothetical protein